MPFNEGHHVIFQGDQIIRVHMEASIVADTGRESERGSGGSRGGAPNML
jgi:hypothetical protein